LENEIAISLAGNYGEKLFLGGSLGIPIVSYRADLTLSESDASANTSNDFSSALYQESYKSQGAGINIKFGAIYVPSPSWRIGLAVHTPTVYSLTDNTTASMNTNTENYAGVVSVSSATLDQAAGVNAGNIKYDMTGPWRFMAGGSYMIGNGASQKSQKGFITADIEYATLRSMKFSAPEIDNNNVDDSYYAPLNSAMKSFVKNTLNFRLGGELKFNLIEARAGLSYYPNPYSDAQLKASKFYFSAGAGYRNKGIFLDLAYVQGSIRDVSIPYRLETKANVYAQIRQTTRTLMLTLGFKF
jgi:hypothetical protein